MPRHEDSAVKISDCQYRDAIDTPPTMWMSGAGKRNISIAVSLMCADPMHLAAQIRQMEDAHADILHVDIMDARFVPNMPVGLRLLEKLSSSTSLPLDVHLMVDDNNFFLDLIADCKVSYISIHAESADHLDRLLAKIQDRGVKAGVALNPATPLAVLDYVLERMDFLLLMTVNPGFAGQQMVPSAIRKIRNARRYLADNDCEMPIQVDGNVSIENIPLMVEAGADILVCGTSSVFIPDHSIRENTWRTREAISQGRGLKKTDKYLQTERTLK